MEFPPHPFWDFTVAVHQRPGVHEACLDLQMRHGVDVNLLFFACWAGAAGGRVLDVPALERLMERAARWQAQIVRPIWEARWRLKPRFEDFPPDLTEPLRRALIQSEVDAEHVEQLQLAATVPLVPNPSLTAEPRLAAAVANAALYLNRALGEPSSLPDDVRAPLVTLLTACFPGVEARQIISLVDRALLWGTLQ